MHGMGGGRAGSYTLLPSPGNLSASAPGWEALAGSSTSADSGFQGTPTCAWRDSGWMCSEAELESGKGKLQRVSPKVSSSLVGGVAEVF